MYKAHAYVCINTHRCALRSIQEHSPYQEVQYAHVHKLKGMCLLSQSVSQQETITIKQGEKNLIKGPFTKVRAGWRET